jgi:DNA-binding NarL/FixJ family response regulator
MENSESPGSKSNPLRVLIADDNYAFRQGLNVLLGFEPDIQVVAVASNDQQTLSLARKHTPEVIVMDLSMGAMSGTDVIRTLVTELPEVRVLVLSGHSDKKMIDGALAAGAAGYLTKSSSLREVPLALRKIRGGAGAGAVRPRMGNAASEI